MADPQTLPEIRPVKTKPNGFNSTTSSSSSLPSTDTPVSSAARKIAIAVDLSDESAYAVKWAVDHYLRPGDAVVLLHVRPTSVLYGADWGSVDISASEGTEEANRKLEDDFDAFTASKAADLALPLSEAQVPYKIHIVKDHDMKERLCLEVERLGFNAVIMGSRGFGASKRASSDRLGSVSDYCVRHCVCPVVVVRYPEDKEGSGGDEAMISVAEAEAEGIGEEEEEFHDASDEKKANA